MKGAPTVRQ